MSAKFRLLIIEDEMQILQGLIDLFTYHGFSVDTASDGETGLRMALQSRYDLLILDVMLPLLDGFSLCERIRIAAPEQPIILLTAKTTDDDIVKGLSLGADDYIAKPFSVRELVLRAEALLRRTKRGIEALSTLVVGSLQIDTRTLQGKTESASEAQTFTLLFTRREVEILTYLKHHAERPVSRGELLSEIWGYSRTGCFETRTIDIHIAKLRLKIEENPKQPRFLRTIRGEGYQLFSD